MSFAVVGEGVALIAYIVILGGGKQKRESGWKILCGILFLVGMIQCAGMALIVSFHLSDYRVRRKTGRIFVANYCSDDLRFF